MGGPALMVRVVLADDHALVRSGIRSLLEASGNVVVGEAANGSDAVRLVSEHKPDVALLDVAMNSQNGIEAAREIRRAHPGVKIVMLSMHDEPQYIEQATAAGASAYVLKESAFDQLLLAIEAVMAGGTFLRGGGPDAPTGRRGSTQTDLDKLTGRERQVLELIADGKSSIEIGKHLSISPRTVDTHRKNIMDKLAVHSIAGLTRFAIKHGLCSLDADRRRE
jgi:DNA-binding NarL/FixJ family response regulator